MHNAVSRFLEQSVSWDTEVPAEAVVQPESTADSDSRGLWELPTYLLLLLNSPLPVKCSRLENIQITKKSFSRILWLHMTFIKLRILHGFFKCPQLPKYVKSPDCPPTGE